SSERPGRRGLLKDCVGNRRALAAGEIDRPDVDVAALRIVSHDNGARSVGREVRLVVEARLTNRVDDFALPVVDRQLSQLRARNSDHESLAVATDAGISGPDSGDDVSGRTE